MYISRDTTSECNDRRRIRTSIRNPSSLVGVVIVIVALTR